MQKKAPPACANRRRWLINLLSLGFNLKSGAGSQETEDRSFSDFVFSRNPHPATFAFYRPLFTAL